MSPEQAAAEEAVGFPSDVFSLGGVLAFAAAGHGPFDAVGAPAVLYRLVHGDPELSGVPEDLAEVVAACLAKAPDERPSPEEVLEELSPLADADATRDGWLPHDLTEEIHRERTRVGPRTERTKRMGDDPGWLRVGNLNPYRIHAIVDGRAVGTVEEFDTAVFPLTVGGYAVQSRRTERGKASEPARHLRIEPDATTGVAFGHSLEGPRPTDSVDYDHDTRGDNPWPGWVGAAAGLIGGLAVGAPFSVDPSVDNISSVLYLVLLATVGGGILVGLAHWGIARLTLPKAPTTTRCP